jgi:LysR family glycine cleavage system transcriptional activator
MVRTLPLNAIRAFEAAGRLSSITKAARELFVTPAAVSHQIKALEAYADVPLFVRSHRAIALTPEGKRYLAEVSRHLAGLRHATSRLRQGRHRRVLRIQAHATIAMRWLIPRLSAFHETHRDIDVQLTTSRDADLDDPELDGAIRLGNGRWPGMRAYRLVANELVPVCAPAFLKRRAHLKRPQGLAKATLLHSLARSDDWSRWLEAMKVRAVDPHGGLKYESSVLAYQAAVEGQGVAIAQKALVESDIDAGRLVYLYDKTVDLGSHTYYYVCPADARRSGHAEVFRKWLVESVARSDAPAPSRGG